jgi:hypothetical protein
MAKRSIPHVTVVILILIISSVLAILRLEPCNSDSCLSRKRLISKSVRYDGFRVSRGEKCVTGHLHFGEADRMRFSFVPTPDFSHGDADA